MAKEIKRLYRSQKNKVLAGVCGGIGEYLEVDPVVIRLIWIIITVLTGGLGIIAYIVSALIIPKK